MKPTKTTSNKLKDMTALQYLKAASKIPAVIKQEASKVAGNSKAKSTD